MSNPKVCPKCGKEYKGKKPWQTLEDLKHLYHGENMTLEEIGKLFGKSDPTLTYWADKVGLDTRTSAETMRLQPPDIHTSADGYERFTTTQDGNSVTTIQHHRLIAVAEHGFDAVASNHVHHKNSIPWDNRPENLKVMDPKDHQKLHYNENKQMLKDKDITEDDAKQGECYHPDSRQPDSVPFILDVSVMPE